ncbi:MAG: SAP domain-containing protein [Candidatus Zixiibacteriota bacterium]
MLFSTKDTPDHHIGNGRINIHFENGYYATSESDEIDILEGHPLIDTELDFDIDIEAIFDRLSSMKKSQLIAVAEFYGMESNGTCNELRERIEKHLMQEDL